MSLIAYRDGILTCEDVALDRLAAEVGTPAYVYSQGLMTERYAALADALAPLGVAICYAVKANSNQAVIALFAGLGAGADIVSEGEMRRALAAGIPAERIVFSGVAKTAAELAFALDQGVGQINVESEPELETISRLAMARGRTVRVAIRINPDVDARTHPKITTGKAENKFGIAIDHAAALYRRAADWPGVRLSAVALHIGSQLLDLAPYRVAYAKLADFVIGLRSDGVAIDHLDLGGGLGVPYRGEQDVDLAAYARILTETVGGLDCTLTVEPGRYLVAEAGVLLSRVVVVKQGAVRRSIVQDAAMNDLLRPTLYEAYHPILPVRATGSPESEADVVGPVCETGDYLATGRMMPRLAAGDLLAICCAGAYGATMSSTYNSRLLVPEVLVRGNEWAIVRPRQTYDALIGQDCRPVWAACR